MRIRVRHPGLCAAALAVAACGGGSGGGAAPAPQVMAAAITMQPASQSVPMGLSATFSVAASGTAVQYQWMKDGAAIAGATASSYVTPPTAFADTGASFRVTVGNSAGSVESAPATLAVTARAPKPGDLRFQLVDAPVTVNGYGNAGTGLSSDLLGRMDWYFSPAIGTQFMVGGNGDCASPPRTDGTGCSWSFLELPMAVAVDSPALLAGYGSDMYANFAADLQAGSTWPQFGNGISPATSASVIHSLDLEPANVLFSVAWIQTSQAGLRNAFDLQIQTVAPAGLAAAAAQAGAASRVITAISYDGGNVTFISYGWSGDPSTVYEVQVTSATPVGAPAAAAALAAQGYIITATGNADATGNVYLVGTRVQGDTMARPFMTAQTSPQILTMWQQGYAEVGSIFYAVPLNTPTPYTYLGER